MSRILSGDAASLSVTMAPAWRYVPPTPGSGQLSLEEAAGRARGELEALAQLLRDSGRGEEAQILDALALMAADPGLLGEAQQLIDEGQSVPDAILRAGDSAAEQLEEIDDELLAARGADVRDVAARIARIAARGERPRVGHRSIAVAADMPPSVTAEPDDAIAVDGSLGEVLLEPDPAEVERHTSLSVSIRRRSA